MPTKTNMSTRDALHDFLGGAITLDGLHAKLQLSSLGSDDELGPIARHLLAEATSAGWQPSDLRREVEKLAGWANLREATRISLRPTPDRQDSTTDQSAHLEQLMAAVGLTSGASDRKISLTSAA